MNRSVSIRGTREGLTVALGNGEIAEILQQLAQHLKGQGAFFRGGLVALEASERSVSVDDLQAIQTLLGEHEMVLRTVISADPETLEAAQSLGLRLVGPSSGAARPAAPRPVQTPPPASASAPADGSHGVLVRRRVRSGQAVRHTGHVVIIGDVNAGGEVYAGGDIIVWGRLLGTAHAGTMGDESAVVCALELSPMQLRIAQLVARPAQDDRGSRQYPEVAYVRDDMIVVDSWDRAQRGA